VADGIDAAVLRHQPPASDAPLDRARAEAGGEQLLGRDHPLLTPSDRSDGRIARCVKKSLTIRPFSPHPSQHAARRARPGPATQNRRGFATHSSQRRARPTQHDATRPSHLVLPLIERD